MRNLMLKARFWIFLAFFATVSVDFSSCIEVHFENKDGGFFLKQTLGNHSLSQEAAGKGGADDDGSSDQEEVVLSRELFTVFQSSQPVSIRATYGPFSTKQTVPARYIVPDPLDVPPSAAPATLLQEALDADLYSHNLDISSHLVTPQIPRDNPVLRVLFHTGQQSSVAATTGGAKIAPIAHRQQRICIILSATLEDKPAEVAACSPGGDDGVCLAQLTVPASWWPPLPGPDYFSEPPHETKPVNKVPRRLVAIAYSVFEPRGSEPCAPSPSTRVQIQPMTPLGVVPLVSSVAPYRELRADPGLAMLLPHAPLYPKSRFYVPLFIQPRPGSPQVSVLVVRARVKSGLKVLGAQSTSAGWHMTVETNPKQTTCTVTVLRTENNIAPLSGTNPQTSDQPATLTNEAENESNPVEEVFNWLFEVEETSEPWEGGRIVWSIRYVLEGDTRFHELRTSAHGTSQFILQQRKSRLLKEGGATQDEDERRKLTARFDTQKDDIHAVLPISKTWEILNTAVLTGRQVSQAMKVFIVSRAGKVADVTLQASCNSMEESVLKVSTSCSSVYVDGSEVRGSSNASVFVQYGPYSGVAKFTVWMPEYPLEVWVADQRLSQVKGWRVPDYTNIHSKIERPPVDEYAKPGIGGWNDAFAVDDKADEGSEKLQCRLRFQQTNVEVYSRFYADDHDIGRISFYGSRRTWLRVTDLVVGSLRVSDSRIASLHGKILQGQSVGRTEVQVVSPVTGRVLGAKEVRVSNDRVTINRLRVRVVSGLQLGISTDNTANGYIATISVTRKLTAQYQEGLLDIEAHFSDDTIMALRDVPISDYLLSVESRNSNVVAFAPMAASPHPRVIAVGEGHGDLLKVSLQLPEKCAASFLSARRGASKSQVQPAPNSILSTAFANVEVDFKSTQKSEFVQNDGHHGGRIRTSDLTKLHDILIGIPLKDENNREPTVQARQLPAKQHTPLMTPLVIGMYVLLGAFCLAIVVFVISCIVYASKFKESELGHLVLHQNRENASAAVQNGNARMGITQNAHDWVWLGRATLERSSNHSSAGIRIINNPGSADVTSFDNPSHIELPSHPPINDNTYTKRVVPPLRTESIWRSNESPPLHQHSTGTEAEAAVEVSQLSPSDPNYKPPVPPHRNLTAAAYVPTLVGPGDSNWKARSPRKLNNHRVKGVKGRDKPLPEVDEDDSSPHSKAKRDMKLAIPDRYGVKRAHIVGNPMFTKEEQEELMASDVGLDLNLGMDYEQILEYFDNLKESNA